MKLNTLYIVILFVSLIGCSKSSQDYFEEGIRKYNAGYLIEATKLFNKTIKIEPENVKARFFIGMCYKKTGKIEQAIEKLHYAYEINPRDFFILYNLADCYLLSNNFDKAISFARKSLEVKPDFMETHLVLGISLLKIKQTVSAQSELNFIIKIIQDNKNPIHKEAMFYLAQLYRDTGNFKESVNLLESLCKNNPSSANYNYSLGLTYLAMGDSKNTEKQIGVLERLKSRLANKLMGKLKK